MIVINSIPRSGTNLCRYMVQGLTGMNASYIPFMLESSWQKRIAALDTHRNHDLVWMHCPYTNSVANWVNENAVVIHVARHVGAIAVSWTHWITSSAKNPFYPIFEGLDFDAALERMVYGNGNKIDVDERCWPGMKSIKEKFAPWGAPHIRYADMLDDPVGAVERIAELIGEEPTDVQAVAKEALARRGYSFRHGSVNGLVAEITDVNLLSYLSKLEKDYA